MNQFDSPVEAFLSQYPEQPKNRPGEAALEIAVFYPLFAIVNIIRKHFLSADDFIEGLRSLAEAVKLEFDWLGAKIAGHGKQIAEIKAKLDSPEFERAYVLAEGNAGRRQ